MREFKGLGDIPNERFDPLQLRYKQRHGGFQPGQPDIVQPPADMPKEEEDRQKQESRILVDEIVRRTLFVRHPNHLMPPVSGQPIDVLTGVPVVIPIGGVLTPLISLVVPPNCVAIVRGFATRLLNPNAYGSVFFSIEWHGEALNSDVKWQNSVGADQRTYAAIRHDIGTIECPCCLPMPWILRGQGLMRILATNNDVVPHQAEAALKGYQYVPDYNAGTVDISAEFRM